MLSQCQLNNPVFVQCASHCSLCLFCVHPLPATPLFSTRFLAGPGDRWKLTFWNGVHTALSCLFYGDLLVVMAHLVSRTRLLSSLLRPISSVCSSANYSKESVPSRLWKVGKLNHVAIAVPDLEKATALYRDILGAKVSEAVPQPDHGVYTVFIELGDTKLELLYPFGDKSPIANFLEKNKSGGMHHICIEVDDIKAAMSDLKKNNIRSLGAEPKIGAHGKPVIFLHPKDCNGVLVELEET